MAKNKSTKHRSAPEGKATSEFARSTRSACAKFQSAIHSDLRFIVCACY
jgi:hypothetical protein